MNATEPRLRWWPRSVRVRTALVAASAAAVILAGIGWWLHRDVYRESTQVAEDQAKMQLWSLCEQLGKGVIPPSTGAIPYEVVATGRRTAVASGGALSDAYPDTRHVMPTPPKAFGDPPVLPTTVHIPANPDYNPRDKFDMAGGTTQVVTADVWADDLRSDQVAALGVASDATLRVYVVVLPHTAEAITETIDRLLLRAGLVSLVLIAAAAYF
ncbi:two-component sensor histidine kinase, partial [Streptomyces sp. NPDC056987]